MKKSSFIILIVFLVLSAFIILFSRNIYNYLNTLSDEEVKMNDYLYGTRSGEHGKISLKLRTDNSGSIKEIFIIEHPDNEISGVALQKLIANSLDKQNSTEIDSVTGATETSNVYKSIIDSLLNKGRVDVEMESTEKISLKEPEVSSTIERIPVNVEGFKSGVGAYVINQFEDADYNKNGNLVTHEYICAVLLNPHDRIEDVRFDHIESNISFNRNGEVPTGGAKAYTFVSDKAKQGFNGLINDGNYVDLFDFEDKVLTFRHFEDIKNRFVAKRGYAPLINALENAITNARYIGASDGDTLGLSAYKVLKKKDIKDSTDEENGHVNFTSNYSMMTVDKEKIISSAMFDNVVNNVTLTNVGKVLGSREKVIYSLNDLSNAEKYSKIEVSRYDLKLQLNTLGDYIRGNKIDDVLALISKSTDAKGQIKDGNELSNVKNIDFIEYIDLISRCFVDAVKIRIPREKEEIVEE